MATIRLETGRITDASSFHRTFEELLGFPDHYGANMDAWIDCMSSLDEPGGGSTWLTLAPGELLTLHVLDAEGFRTRLPDLFADLVDCTAFVNRRYVEAGTAPPIALVLL